MSCGTGAHLEVCGHGLVVLVVCGEAVPVGQPHATRARLQALRLAQVAASELALAYNMYVRLRINVANLVLMWSGMKAGTINQFFKRHHQ